MKAETWTTQSFNVSMNILLMYKYLWNIFISSCGKEELSFVACCSWLLNFNELHKSQVGRLDNAL